MSRASFGIFVASLFLAVNAAAAPQLMNFQGRLTDSSGNPLTGTYSVLFSVWDTGPGTGGSELWSETQSLNSNNGIVSAQLGAVTALPVSLFSSSNRWLEIKIGTNTALSPRQQLVSVAYSLDAASLDNGAVTPLSASSGVYTNIYLPSGNLNGVVPDQDMDSSSVTLRGNSFNGANELLLLDGGGKLPASVFNGSAALLASSQTFTGSPTFASTVAFAAQNASLPSVTVSSGLVVEGGYVGIGTANPRAPLAVDEVGNLGYSVWLSSGLNAPNGTINAANVNVSGLLSLEGSRIVNVGLPVSTGDAVNLFYLNTATTAAAAYAIGQATAISAAGLTASSNVFTAQQTFGNTATFVSSVTVKNALGASSETITNSLTVGGSVTASSFTGVGTGLTNLNASDLSTGTVPDARLDVSSVTLQGNTFNGSGELLLLDSNGKLPASVFNGSAALLASSQTFTGSPLFASSVTVNNILGASSETLTNTLTVGEGVTASSFTGNGAALTNLDANHITSGSLGATAGEVTVNLSSLSYTGQLPAQYVQFSGAAALLASTQTFSGQNTFLNDITVSSGAAISGNLNVGGSIAGNLVSNINAYQVNPGSFQAGSYEIPLGSLSFGTLLPVVIQQANPQLSLDNVLTSNTAIQLKSAGTVFGTIGNLTGQTGTLQLSGGTSVTNGITISSTGFVGIGTTLPHYGLDAYGDVHSTGVYYGNGSGLTNLDASNISSGTLGAAGGEITVNLSSLTYTGKLPAQYVQFSGVAALLPSSQTFTGADTFSSTAAFTAQDASAPSVTVSSGLVVSMGYVGIGTANPRAPLSVDEVGARGYSLYLSSGLFMSSGTVNAANFIGNGLGLTDLNASNINTGTLGATAGELTVNLSSLTFTGQIPAQYVQFTGSAALLASTQTFTGTNTFSNPATFQNGATIDGSGAGGYSVTTSSGVLVGGAITSQAAGGSQGQLDPSNPNYLSLRVDGVEVARMKP